MGIPFILRELMKNFRVWWKVGKKELIMENKNERKLQGKNVVYATFRL